MLDRKLGMACSAINVILPTLRRNAAQQAIRRVVVDLEPTILNVTGQC